MHLDLTRDIACEQCGLASEAFAGADGRVVPREDAFGFRELTECSNDVIATGVDSRAQQLDDEPSVVAIADERRERVALTMDEAVGGSVLAERGPSFDRVRDPGAPPVAIDRCVRVRVDEAKRDFRLWTPERSSDGPAAVVEDANGSGWCVWRFDDIAPKDPGVSVGPALGALGGDGGVHVGKVCVVARRSRRTAIVAEGVRFRVAVW